MMMRLRISTTTSRYTKHHIINRTRSITNGKIRRNHFDNNGGNLLQKISNTSWRSIGTSTIHNDALYLLLHANDRQILAKHLNHDDNEESQQILSCSMVQKNQNNDRRIIEKIANKIIQHARALWDAIMVLLRTSEIGLRFSPLIILTPAAILASQRIDSANKISSSSLTMDTKNIGRNTSIVSDVAWQYTLYTIQKLGPAFIKMGQQLSTLLARRTCQEKQPC